MRLLWLGVNFLSLCPVCSAVRRNILTRGLYSKSSGHRHAASSQGKSPQIELYLKSGKFNFQCQPAIYHFQVVNSGYSGKAGGFHTRMGNGGDEKLVHKEWHQCGESKSDEDRGENEQSTGKVEYNSGYHISRSESFFLRGSTVSAVQPSSLSIFFMFIFTVNVILLQFELLLEIQSLNKILFIK